MNIKKKMLIMANLDNPDDVIDSKDELIQQEINAILESIVSGDNIDNLEGLLDSISSSAGNMSSINSQLESIINT